MSSLHDSAPSSTPSPAADVATALSAADCQVRAATAKLELAKQEAQGLMQEARDSFSALKAATFEEVMSPDNGPLELFAASKAAFHLAISKAGRVEAEKQTAENDKKALDTALAAAASAAATAANAAASAAAAIEAAASEAADDNDYEQMDYESDEGTRSACSALDDGALDDGALDDGGAETRLACSFDDGDEGDLMNADEGAAGDGAGDGAEGADATAGATANADADAANADAGAANADAVAVAAVTAATAATTAADAAGSPPPRPPPKPALKLRKKRGAGRKKREADNDNNNNRAVQSRTAPREKPIYRLSNGEILALEKLGREGQVAAGASGEGEASVVHVPQWLHPLEACRPQADASEYAREGAAAIATLSQESEAAGFGALTCPMGVRQGLWLIAPSELARKFACRAGGDDSDGSDDSGDDGDDSGSSGGSGGGPSLATTQFIDYLLLRTVHLAYACRFKPSNKPRGSKLNLTFTI